VGVDKINALLADMAELLIEMTNHH